MKNYLMRFFLLLMTGALMLSGCGSKDGEESSSASSEEPTSIGSDWRSLRGYSNESYPYFSGQVLLSLFDNAEEGFGFSLYDAEDGGYRGKIVVTEQGCTKDDIDGWRLCVEDFNEDGVPEYGIPMKDGRVLWYEFGYQDGYTYFGPGTPEKVDGGFPARVGAGWTKPYPFAGEDQVRFSFSNQEGNGGYLVCIAGMEDYILGQILVDEETTGCSIADLDRAGPDQIFAEDIDKDQIMEFGLGLNSGDILWYDWSDELEDFRYYGREELPDSGGEKGKAAAEVLMKALGDQMNGKALLENGTVKLEGVSCVVFQYGTNTPDAFQTEKNFAVSPEGRVYIMDIAKGPEYLPYIP